MHPSKRSELGSRRRPATALCLALWLGASFAHAEEQLVDGIAAQVGNDIVLVSEVLELAAPVEERMRASLAPDAQIQAMRAEVLERLIEARLISELVHRMELTATPEEIDSAIEGIAQETGLTMRQLAESVTSHGLTFEEYRSKIASEIERNKVLNSLIRSQVRIEEKEIQAVYDERFSNQRTGGDEIHLHHLVVAFGAEFMRDRATACTIAAEGAERIASGEFGFDEVAARLSDSPSSGDMGWVHASDLAGWMVGVVNRLEPGEVSDVVETPFGCHLLMVEDKRGFEPISFEEARPEIENELFRRKSEARYVEWLEQLRGQTYIERKGVFAKASPLS